MWANLTAAHWLRRENHGGWELGQWDTLKSNRIGSEVSMGVCLREVGGRDLKGNKDFNIDLGLKTIIPGQEYYEYFL